jgi:serine/threonine protein kinase
MRQLYHVHAPRHAHLDLNAHARSHTRTFTYRFLRERCTDNRLGEAQARWLFQQFCIGLDFCHRMGVANRDLKLENLLLDLSGANSNPTIKICDFGYSKVCERKERRGGGEGGSFSSRTLVLESAHAAGLRSPRPPPTPIPTPPPPLFHSPTITNLFAPRCCCSMTWAAATIPGWAPPRTWRQRSSSASHHTPPRLVRGVCFGGGKAVRGGGRCSYLTQVIMPCYGARSGGLPACWSSGVVGE